MLEVGYLGMFAAHIQSNILAYNQINFNNLPAALNPFTASGRTLLNSQVGSAAANAAGGRDRSMVCIDQLSSDKGPTMDILLPN